MPTRIGSFIFLLHSFRSDQLVMYASGYSRLLYLRSKGKRKKELVGLLQKWMSSGSTNTFRPSFCPSGSFIELLCLSRRIGLRMSVSGGKKNDRQRGFS